jgi:hypothetical protein
MRWMAVVSVPGRSTDHSFTIAFELILGPKQLPVTWEPETSFAHVTNVWACATIVLREEAPN